MPNIAAMLAASLIGWLVEPPVRAVAGAGASIATSLLVSAVAFAIAKRWLSDLRGGL